MRFRRGQLLGMAEYPTFSKPRQGRVNFFQEVQVSQEVVLKEYWYFHNGDQKRVIVGLEKVEKDVWMHTTELKTVRLFWYSFLFILSLLTEERSNWM